MENNYVSKIIEFSNKNITNSNMSITNKADTPSILSRGLHVKGDIKSSGILEIEGEVKGTIKGNCVVIREDGFVDGKINSDSVNIHGSFSGDIKAGNINIFKKAKIIGNIEYNSLSVEDGAYIDGQFKRNTANAGGKIANEDQSKITKVKVS